MTQTLERDAVATVAAAKTRRRRWVRPVGAGAVLVLFVAEITIGWSSLAPALRQLRTPHVGWLALVVVAELAAMSAYAHMQRRLLRSAGVRPSYGDNVRLAYAAHSLNETLPGGPAFSTRLNFQQMRRFGASPAVASWAIALSGLLSAIALAAITAGVAFASGGATSWTDIVLMLTAVAVIILGVRHLASHPTAAGSLLRRPVAVLNRLRRRPATEGHDRVTGFVDQLRTARLRPADGIAAAVYALLNWILDAGALWLCFYAVGEHSLSPTATLLAFCAAMAAGSVTIVPGGLGIVDSALLLGLVTGGADLSVAVSVVVLYRIVSFGFIIGLGWFFWLQLRVCPERPALRPARRATAGSRSGPRTSPRLLGVCPGRRPVPHSDATDDRLQPAGPPDPSPR
ncbi:lysylphosphatidylglycerol synthase transmembrane domain-containing protein [Actinoplanes sp. M2I2]|uniref:lysylphosphatidylglycerol synthase transmembrane domain-containing protein n=1 Tax=Actinoplanes sp. M2I2 TaxID=1734444 RepID=UPI0020228DEB|nr:lysylphosphatidylglycerol synthase transmembrane domain-containing protein [Actinoplanes sp. M2I2]